MFQRLLIANRGEIACRIIATARKLGIETIAVYSDADANARHVALADRAFRIGPAPAAQSYLDGQKIVDVAKRAGAEAIHPGYGFLSENADFAELCENEGLTFVGPPATAIRAMGLKDAAKKLMEEAGVPVVPGYHGDSQDPGFLRRQADEIGFPVLIKAVAGGGGKGIRRVDRLEDFDEALAGARREAQNSFGNPGVLIEKFIEKPRHIEIQVFADTKGNAVHLFERDCSLQRRHQKVIEEAPAPGMSGKVRAAMGAAAVRAAQAIGYVGAGTIEFIADGAGDPREDGFWFMEMNTRLQVEHPVTEMISGQDLVAWQLEVAAGGTLPATQDELTIAGHAVEARIYAEDAENGFLPAPGRIAHLYFPQDLPGVRVDTGVRAGDMVTAHYDPMIAKLIVRGPDRATALARLAVALERTEVTGTTTNTAFLARLARHPDFVAGKLDTGLIDRSPDLTGQGAVAPPAELRLAAAAILRGALAEPANDPWGRHSGFRLWGSAEDYADLEWGEGPHTIRLRREQERWSAEMDGGVLSVSFQKGRENALVLDFGDRKQRIRFVKEADVLTLFAPAGTFSFRPVAPGGGAAEETEDRDRIVAPLPGIVSALHVAAGQEVKAGFPLIVIEAMKMEHTLRAPRDGRVQEVRAQEGDQVGDGDVLIVLEEAGNDA